MDAMWWSTWHDHSPWLLFKEWGPQTDTGYILGCFGVALFSVFNAWLMNWHQNCQGCSPIPRALKPRRGGPSISDRLVLSLGYALKITTGYLIMLLVMTFNPGVFVSIIAGIAVGSHLFRCVDAVEKRGPS
mmetsp:Transcript_55335/g.130636  ORF Transcript_55335/g.130636 Transcript_55335/m.130636 type:complete len:131 (+) Transcript_55335:65-457(+)